MLYRKTMLFVSGAVLSSMAVPAQSATVVSSSASDISIDLRLLSLAAVGLGPLTSAGGSAGVSYANSDTLASADDTLTLGALGLVGVQQRLTTGVLTSAAQSPFPVSQSGSGRAEVDDLSTALGTVFLGQFTNLLGINATSVVSRSSVAAPGGIASATGFTQIEGLTLSGSLLGNVVIDGSLFVNPDPNTVLFSLGVLGSETLRIILNEQVPVSNGVHTAGISTNAIHVILNGLPVGTGLVSGNIYIARSQALISDAEAAVPEPAMWAQMIAGFALAGLVMRRRQRSASLALPHSRAAV